MHKNLEPVVEQRIFQRVRNQPVISPTRQGSQVGIPIVVGERQVTHLPQQQRFRQAEAQLVVGDRLLESLHWRHRALACSRLP